MKSILENSYSQVQNIRGILESLILISNSNDVILYVSNRYDRCEIKPIILRGEKDLVYCLDCEGKRWDLTNFIQNNTKYLQ